MLNSQGRMMIPCCMSGDQLVDFITNNRVEATTRIHQAEHIRKEEIRLISRCMEELGLIRMDRHDSVTPKQMIHCCNSLLGNLGQIRHLTHGSHIIVSRYYMVQSDGIICIPWFLTFGAEFEADPDEIKIYKPL